MATILNIWRPDAPVDQTGETISLEPADFLFVRVDEDGLGRSVTVIKIAFADHAGLEAEFDAGVATTLLDVAITGEEATADYPDDDLTPNQRDYVVTAP